MKKLLLLALTALVIVGCDNRQLDGRYTPAANPRTYVIDSCEYIGFLETSDYLAHKGNCRYCAERRKQELKELIKEARGE